MSTEALLQLPLSLHLQVAAATPTASAAQPTLSSLALYANWPVNLAVVLATACAVMLAVLIHYEGLQFFTSMQAAKRESSRPGRRTVLYVVFWLLGLHIAEIWTFGLAYHFLLQWPETGRIVGLPSTHIFDHIYFSATVFTTVGFGDLSPVGPIRFMAGTEGLTGFLLIGWSASFTYLEMETLWRRRG
ncbi:MAG: two pore domain potassium channel family protein [Betaproteobacteria bacterium]|nr:two pore domain potassium channel family protein [Betaproteobacteria bacterium]